MTTPIITLIKNLDKKGEAWGSSQEHDEKDFARYHSSILDILLYLLS
jgi:hypothetical protein